MWEGGGSPCLGRLVVHGPPHPPPPHTPHPHTPAAQVDVAVIPGEDQDAGSAPKWLAARGVLVLRARGGGADGLAEALQVGVGAWGWGKGGGAHASM